MDKTLIHFPRSEFLDKSTGRPTREWVQWLQNPNVVTLSIGGGGALGVNSGGTGLTTIPTLYQILIGTGSGYSLGTIASIFPVLSGDVSNIFGSTTITLNNVNTNIGSFGSANKSVTVNLDAKGRVLSASDQQINTNILGTVTNDSAAAGVLGEYLSANLSSGAALSLTTATPLSIISISLTAGDWDVGAACAFHGSGTTNVAYLTASISAANNTLGSLGQLSTISPATVFTVDQLINSPTTRISIATTTIIYLVAQSGFTISTLTAYGLIWARRAR